LLNVQDLELPGDLPNPTTSFPDLFPSLKTVALDEGVLSFFNPDTPLLHQLFALVAHSLKSLSIHNFYWIKSAGAAFVAAPTLQLDEPRKESSQIRSKFLVSSKHSQLLALPVKSLIIEVYARAFTKYSPRLAQNLLLHGLFLQLEDASFDIMMLEFLTVSEGLNWRKLGRWTTSRAGGQGIRFRYDIKSFRNC